MNSTAKTIMGWGLAIACCLLIYTVMTKNAGSGGKVTDIGYSDLLDKTEAGQVYDATIQGNEVRGHLKGSKDEFRTTVYANTIDTLTKDKTMHGRLMPSKWIMYNVKKPDHSTTMKVDDMNFDTKISDKIFSYQELERGN